MVELLLVALCVFTLVLIGLVMVVLKRQQSAGGALERVEQIRRDMAESQKLLRLEMAETTQKSVRAMGEMLGERQELTRKGVLSMQSQIEARLANFSLENEQKLDNMRATMEKRLTYIQEDNNKKLDEMRALVDEKLQKTLNERMTQSFALVNERLEQVYKGLGEMQTLAVGVGDLKRVLSGVKTRGIVGEIQLGAILSELLAPEQYETNMRLGESGNRFVEFAVKLPGDDGSGVYLPIDSKFPIDAYEQLVDAMESGAQQAIKEASDQLGRRVRGFAKDIRDKYISPPQTTDFAVMFLPTEGMYAEAVRLGLFESVQREYRVCIAGPSTMAALLNSLQMGFRSLAIQKRSSEVWKVLGAVKTEFEKFQDVLTRTQARIDRAHDDLELLIGTRTRQINRTLKEVTALPTEEVAAVLPELKLIAMGDEDDAQEG